MSKKLAQSFICECNGINYPNNSRLKTHQRSMKHQFWAVKKELVELKGVLTVKDNELMIKQQIIEDFSKKNENLKKELEIEKLATEKAYQMINGKKPKRRRKIKKNISSID